MNIIISIILLTALLPLQVLVAPAALTSMSVVAPLSMFYFVRQIYSRNFYVNTHLLFVFIVVVGLVLAVGSSLVGNSELSIFSYLSFTLPMYGLPIGYLFFTRAKLFRGVVDMSWLPALLFACTLLISMLANSFVVRQTFLAVGEDGVPFYALKAVASFFGFPYFGLFGVNSFAGICLSLVFLYIFFYLLINSKYAKIALGFSASTIWVFGALLQSRAFFIGTLVFVAVILYYHLRNAIWRVVATSIAVLCMVYIATLDDRVAATIADISSGDWATLSSNRTTLWSQFSLEGNILWGSAFQPLLSDASASTSYHLYLLTTFGKGGLIILVPICILFLRSVLPIDLHRKKTVYKVVYAANISFFVQALFWDSYYVQLYGHVAWFFIGVWLSRLQVKRGAA